MNLFIVEGYKDAAKAFAKESGIERESDMLGETDVEVHEF